MTKRKNLWLYCLSFAAVLLFFQLDFGWKVLIPSNVSWLMTVKSDWNTHYLGWFFYRNEPWQFPLGKISGYFYPLGTNVGFTDSIPLMALVFKLLSPLLPADFQYFGAWLLLCHLLIAYFVIRICELFRLKPIMIFLAVIFMTQNPVLLYRSMHPALCAHWLFLASAYLYLLDPSQMVPEKIFRRQLLLLLLSALITPYLLVIEFGFTLILLWKHLAYDRSISWKYAGVHLAISAVSGALIWLLMGMLVIGNKEHLAINGGFGKLSMNLNAFYDPSIWSSFLPEQKRTNLLQYEGFMYLGVGIFFLIGVLLVYRLTTFKKTAALTAAAVPAGAATSAMPVAPKPPAPRDLPRVVVPPLAVFCGILAFAAITNVVSFNDKVLFTIPVPAIVTNTGDIFRASGRFFWPVYYLILFWLIIQFSRSRWPEGLKTALLTLALLIQLYDIKMLLTYQQPSYGTYAPPVSKRWDAIMRPFNKVLFYPPFETDYLGQQDYQYFAFMAAREKKPIDVAYVARADYSGMSRYRDSLETRLIGGNIDTGALYITTPAHLAAFGPALLRDKLDVDSLDGYYYLSTQKSAAHLKDSIVQAFVRQKIEFQPVDSLGPESDTIFKYTESVVVADNAVVTKGFAFLKAKKNNNGDSLFLYLRSGTRSYSAPLRLIARPDLTAHFKAEYLDDAGFEGTVFEDDVDKGTYQLGLAIKQGDGKWFYKLLGLEVRLDRTDR